MTWKKDKAAAQSEVDSLQEQLTATLEKLDQLERGFDDIEHRISNMDKEHSRYVKATVTRMGYLLNQEDDMKGLVIQLLNHLPKQEEQRMS